MKVWIDSVGNVVWEDPNNRDPLLIQLDSNTRRAKHTKQHHHMDQSKHSF